MRVGTGIHHPSQGELILHLPAAGHTSHGSALGTVVWGVPTGVSRSREEGGEPPHTLSPPHGHPSPRGEIPSRFPDGAALPPGAFLQVSPAEAHLILH